MIIIYFFRWIIATVLISFLASFPVALAVVAASHLFWSGIDYWQAYEVSFWALVVIQVLTSIVGKWE